MRGEGYSLADIAAATGNGNNNGFGGDGAWIIIFLIFALGGFGGNGLFGGRGNGGGSVADMYTLNSDFATLQRLMSDGFNTINSGINQVNQGLCNGFYQELVNINGVNQNIMQTGYSINNAINGVQSQLAGCCCGIERSIDGVNYNTQAGFNSVNQTICGSTRDIIDSQVNGTRAILDAITANRIEDKNAQIQAQQNEINALRLAASQERQNSYLLSELKPCPSAAYIVPNPNCCYNYTVSQNSCGCNCGNY